MQFLLLRGVYRVCDVYSERVGLRNKTAVQKLQSFYLQCLYIYLKGQHPGNIYLITALSIVWYNI